MLPWTSDENKHCKSDEGNDSADNCDIRCSPCPTVDDCYPEKSKRESGEGGPPEGSLEAIIIWRRIAEVCVVESGCMGNKLQLLQKTIARMNITSAMMAPITVQQTSVDCLLASGIGIVSTTGIAYLIIQIKSIHHKIK